MFPFCFKVYFVDTLLMIKHNMINRVQSICILFIYFCVRFNQFTIVKEENRKIKQKKIKSKEINKSINNNKGKTNNYNNKNE